MTPAIAQRVELTGGDQVWTDAQRMLVRLSTGKSIREGVKYSASAFSGVRKSMPENPACRNFAPISSGVKKLTKGSLRSEGKVGGSDFILDLKHPLQHGTAFADRCQRPAYPETFFAPRLRNCRRARLEVHTADMFRRHVLSVFAARRSSAHSGPRLDPPARIAPGPYLRRSGISNNNY